MLAKRIIPCLDVTGGRVVKGVNFVNLIDAGDPVEAAIEYDRQGADELVFLDITATSDNRSSMYDVVRRTAENVFIPLTVGGGIRTVEDIRRMLNSGRERSGSASSALSWRSTRGAFPASSAGRSSPMEEDATPESTPSNGPGKGWNSARAKFSSRAWMPTVPRTDTIWS